MSSFLLALFDPVGAVFRDIECEMEADFLRDLVEVAEKNLSPLLEQTCKLISNNPDDLQLSLPSIKEAARWNGRELTKPWIRAKVTVPSQNTRSRKRILAGYYIIRHDLSETTEAPLTIRFYNSNRSLVYSTTIEKLSEEHFTHLHDDKLNFLKTCHL